MAKLLLDAASRRIRRYIEDNQSFPDSYYDKGRFPSWDVVEVPLTVSEVRQRINVVVVQKFVPVEPKPEAIIDFTEPFTLPVEPEVEPAESPVEDMYWKHPDTSLWYKLVERDFSGLYYPEDGTVGPGILTHEENLLEPVTQEFIDGLNASGVN